MYICIPKYIKIDNNDLIKFWDNESIYKYIKNLCKYTTSNKIDDTHKLFNTGNTIEFIIYTKKFNKNKLLDFFTYKKIHMIQVQDIVDKNIDENIKFTDYKDNDIDLLHLILDDNYFIYKCYLKL